MGTSGSKDEEKTPIVKGEGEAKRKNIVQEILATEETYARSLGVIQDIYIQQLKEQQILTEEQITKIFGNWQELLQFHRDTLLPQIRNRVGVWDKKTHIGDVFLKLLDTLKMYSTYVNNYNSGLMELSAQQRRKKNFDKFLQKAKENTETKGLDILSYLIMPVQRLPRYVMLLNELKKSTSPKHSDFKNIEKAVHGLEGVASYVNEQKRISENLQELLVIQNSFSGTFDEDIAQEHRLILATGETKVDKDKASWWIFCDRLLVGTPSAMGKVFHTFGGKEHYTKLIWAPLWNIEVIVDPKKSTAVSVEVAEGSKKKKYTFVFGSQEGRDEWAEGVMTAKSRSYVFRDSKNKENPKKSFSLFSSSSSSSSSSKQEEKKQDSSRCCI